MESSLLCNRAFLLHKPTNVVCSTVDAAITNIVQKKHLETFGQMRGGESRLTVYDVAEKAGFPITYSLVGRLDAETSGIILFTNNTQLLSKVCHPAVSIEDYYEHRTYMQSVGIAPAPLLDCLGCGDDECIDDTSVTSYEHYLRTKSKQYELVILSGRNVIKELRANSLQFNPADFEAQLSEPFNFHRNNEEIETSGAKVDFVERYQDPAFSHGKSELGWCIKCLVTLREGKHHQIRRMAKRHDYHVLSLKRARIASILSVDTVPNPGDCRWLTTCEYETLCRHLGVAI